MDSKGSVEGVTRAQVTSLDETGTYMTGQAVELEDIKSADPELFALGKATVQQFEHYIKLNKNRFRSGGVITRLKKPARLPIRLPASGR